MHPANLYGTIARPPEPPVSPMSRRDRDHPKLNEHLRGLCGWIMSHAGGGPPTPAQAHAVEHVWRVHHHFTFDLHEVNEDELLAFAREANALVFLPQGTLNNPGAEVVVGPGATGDVPYPERGRARAKASADRLRAEGFQVPGHLPPVPCEQEVVLRTRPEVCARIRGLVAVAVSGEARAAGDPIPFEQLMERLRGASLTARDEQFLKAPDVPREALPEFTWKYESAHALLWAVGLMDELGDPGGICDVPAVTQAALSLRDEDAQLRPLGEILDALDMHYRQHWLTVDHEHNGGAAVPWQRGVLYERRVAWNWLSRLGEFDWDEVPAPT